MGGMTRGELLQAVLPSVVALIVGAASAFTALHVMEYRMGALEERVGVVEGDLKSHVALEGHPVMMERVKNMTGEQ